MTGIQCVGGKMDATRTYCNRWWKWICTPGLPCEGILLLGQMTEKKGDVDEQLYGIEEVKCSHLGGRSFAVRKLGAAVGSEEEAYTTTIMPRNSVCTCKSGRTRTEVCRHRDGIKAAIDANAITQKQLIGA
jgi:hypothetical protein